ncbi:hypothetical protein Poli38472_007948 [Pythium oligandrum]|uniref:catechol O-methyltransferase n=1 Tax=Pythium oligandrum TaxID=41045 RepID=A0A8K1CMC5_PYTOL|nr:hypothetical protein Poli38472_007948 [Pythium oligandrum]|eukprot:TMW65306.1 hypothetical protein Poli38472_007948 [Pythium oligandrum]
MSSMSARLAELRKLVQLSPPKCLAYVKQHAERGNPQSVIDTIDKFCTKVPMMNIGRPKGAFIDECIRQTKPLVMAELGGYSGYSAVRFASMQKQVVGPEAHYYSFEYSPEFAEIVREMVAFAGLSNNVTVVTGAFADQYETIKDKTVGIYFIDHEKTCYVNDAKLIINSGTLRKGSQLIADNIFQPGATDYVAFMEDHSQFVTMRNVVEWPSRDGGIVQDTVLVSEFQG